jgi:CheY-like chemotaxis protein
VSEEQGETITLKVSDTGMGISEDHIESIFDPFAQSEGGKTAGGTGLGLAISVRMVEGMGGTLSVESELGVGSTFTVVLPLSEVDDRELAAVESPGLGGDNPDLVLAPDQDVLALVADDREANRDVLVQLMAAAGFRTVQAANGREALDMMREHRPQVVLMDVRMPEMDGVTAVGIIREDADLKDTCVIAVSASVFPDSAQRFRDAGFDDFIGKPLAAGELFRKLGEHAGVQYVDLGGTEEDDGAEATGTTVLTTEEAEGIASRIRSAVEVGDVAALTALAAELESSGGPASAYAGRIADLVGMFDFTGLSALADEIESAPPSEP